MRMRAKYVSVMAASGRGVAERWQRQYCRDGKWLNAPIGAVGGSEQIYKSLCALGPTPRIEDVAEIIGNKSWSYISCSACPEYVEKAVSIGEHEGRAYCETCVREAYAIITGEA